MALHRAGQPRDQRYRRTKGRPADRSKLKPCLSCGGDVDRFFINGNPRKYCDACHSITCRCGLPKSREHARCMECALRETRRPEQVCVVCAKRFRPKEADRGTCCGRRCGLRYMRLLAAGEVRASVGSGGRARSGHRARARRFGVPYRPVDPKRILDRDGWRCGLCGKAISRRAMYPSPNAPTIDHIIPMSKGGGHVPENLQAAHQRCNSRKQAGACGSQLLLVG